VTNVRNKHCISLRFSNQIIQIILRLYGSVSEILHGFDIGSSAVGYNGRIVYFTSLSKFSFEYIANIIDPSRRSTTYEKRIMKYHDRGFQIILPYLDINKLRTEYHKYDLCEICKLPYLIFSYKSVIGNKIYLHKLLDWGTNANKNEAEKPDSDYQHTEVDEYKAFYLNLKNLVRNSQNFYYFSKRMNYDILKDPPYITRSRIIDFYDSLKKRIYDKSNFNAKIFCTYLSSDLLPLIVNKLFIDKDNSYLDELIQQQKLEILDRYDGLIKIDHSKLSWITKNPGTQLTSSFNPIISNEVDWYGYYYTKLT